MNQVLQVAKAATEKRLGAVRHALNEIRRPFAPTKIVAAEMPQVVLGRSTVLAKQIRRGLRNKPNFSDVQKPRPIGLTSGKGRPFMAKCFKL